MRIDETRKLARDLELIGSAGAVAGLTDSELLGRFVGRRDGAAEVAFEALVGRHGGMVLGTCRRVLRDPVEAEDAFQATFLVLARKAGSVRVDGSLAPWLHGVARRVAGKARAGSIRRRRFESSSTAAGAEPSSEATLDEFDLRPILFEELDRLPEKYRTPVVLCHLEGKTHEEAAQELRWPVGTVSGRLSRARDLLRSRLARRGLSPTASGVVAALAGREAVAISPSLSSATARLATRFAAGEAIPESIQRLTQGALTAMFANQIKLGAIAASAVAMLTVGAGYVAGQIGGGAAPTQVPPARNEPPSPDMFKAAKPIAPAQSPVAPAPVQPPPRDIPGFPKYSERTRQARIDAQKNIFRRTDATIPIPAMQNASMVAVTAPDGRSLRAMSLLGGVWREYQVAQGFHTMPIWTGDMLALAVSGPSVREVAVFDASNNGGSWARQALREPLDGELIPTVGPGLALYQVGNDFYAYSVQAGKWGALHLEGGEAAQSQFACNDTVAKDGRANAIFVRQGQKLHVFSVPLGQWSEGVELKVPEPGK
jgi:RNA polymerase sigma factor (sigma-70 family)